MESKIVKSDVVNISLPTEQKVKYAWVSPVVTTVIGIVVAIGLTWYQINRSEQEERKAEVERAKTVKTTLVSIVEDHVINNQPIDIKRLSRLVDIKSREEDILTPPRLLEIVQVAELNIINSGYLDFTTKESYKEVFDTIYDDVRKDYKVDFNDVRNPALIEQVVSSIKTGNSEESLANLKLLIEAYSSDINELEVKSNKKSDLKRISDLITNEPLFIVGLLLAYIVFFILFFPRFRRILRVLKEDRDNAKVPNKDTA